MSAPKMYRGSKLIPKMKVLRSSTHGMTRKNVAFGDTRKNTEFFFCVFPFLFCVILWALLCSAVGERPDSSECEP